MTGCKKPCFYKEYKFIGNKKVSYFVSENPIFSLWVVSYDTFVETEKLIYPLSSLVAEIGGTLGLFLGFSFMTFWDGLLYLSHLKMHLTNIK